MPGPEFRWGDTPGSFTNQARLTLQDLQSKPELNGQVVQLCTAGAPGRWGVAVDGGAPISVAGAKLKLPHFESAHCDVRISDTQPRSDAAGKIASCNGYFVGKGWALAMPNSEETFHLPSSCIAATSGSPLVDPVTVGTRTLGGRSQHCLVANRDFGAGDVLFFEENAIMIPNPPEDVSSAGFKELFWQLAVATRQFLELPEDRRRAVLELNAPDTFAHEIASASPLSAEVTVKSVELSQQKVLSGISGAGQEIPAEAQDDVWRLARIWRSNALPVEGGLALAVTLSRTNHSCRPNAFRAEAPNNAVTLVALAPIRQGEEICISYVADMQLLQPRELRWQALRHWCSLCECPTCVADADTTRSAKCFQKKKCRGVHRMVREALQPCDKCGAAVTETEQQRLLGSEKSFAHLFGTIDNSPSAVSQAQCQMMLHGMEEVERLFAPDHWLVARFHGLLVEYEEQMDSHTAARRHAAAILQFLDAHLQRPSIRRALQRGVLSRAELRLGNRLEAARLLLAALEEISHLLPATHGHCADLREDIEKLLTLA